MSFNQKTGFSANTLVSRRSSQAVENDNKESNDIITFYLHSTIFIDLLELFHAVFADRWSKLLTLFTFIFSVLCCNSLSCMELLRSCIEKAVERIHLFTYSNVFFYRTN